MNKKLMLLVLGAMFVFIGSFSAPVGAQELGLQIDDSELKGARAKIFEAYLGGTAYSYEKEDGGQSNDGTMEWLRPRFIPIHLKKMNLKLGVSVYGAQGQGESNNLNAHPWEYQWNEFAGCFVFKPYWSGGDATVDVGYGKHTDKGGITIDPEGIGSGGRYDSDHTDDMFTFAGNLSFYGRRNARKNFFPRTEVNVDYFKMSNPDYHESWTDNNPDPKWSWKDVNPNPSEKGTPGDASRWNVEARIWVYDFWLNDNFHITPGVIVGTGHENAQDASYNKAGVGLDIGTRRFSFLNVSCEYKDGEKEKGTSLSAWVAVKF